MTMCMQNECDCGSASLWETPTLREYSCTVGVVLHCGSAPTSWEYPHIGEPL
eukprot:CAMPEP_0177485524 /NCGR_PEP_ID=MMETSP0369-20130122/28603_1 /TAXON_ID=447022 ORGANISM="Scrippsiella hangoei-like, Strain SHHI-4" /NCGR_SAMPLE_ID=MMETSP0369 /ASSEMBLY_ACC=CAM_ASM_000364 /LENGTH=51 /DNA_ID=CAMNT_0018961701 /DNA_START=437 /DNA_END=589 /DNA_ORIENTATION=-